MHAFQENISTNKSLTCAFGTHISINLIVIGATVVRLKRDGPIGEILF